MDVQIKFTSYKRNNSISALSFLHNFPTARQGRWICDCSDIQLHQDFMKDRAKQFLPHRACIGKENRPQLELNRLADVRSSTIFLLVMPLTMLKRMKGR